MSRPEALADDPNVKMPSAVRAQIARSEAAFASQSEQREQFEQEAQSELTQQGNINLSSEAPIKVVATAPAAQTVAVVGDESWEHKYKSMHGRHIASQESNKIMTDEIRGLQNLIATMNEAPAQAAAPAEKLVTSDEVNDYGEEFLNVVGRKAREELASELSTYRAEIAQLKAQVKGVSGVQRQTLTEELHTTLDNSIPSWREINRDAKFIDWLGLPDPFSGGIRMDMLSAAYSQGNASRVLAFFNGFLVNEAAMAPVQNEPDFEAVKVPKIPLRDLAAPGRAKVAATPPPPDEKPLLTRSQIQAFYSDVAAQKYRGREPEKNRLEAMIFEAQRDGRIR